MWAEERKHSRETEKKHEAAVRIKIQTASLTG